jgi:hypothetical protein
MSEEYEIVTVGAGSVDTHRFFCYESRPESPGYGNKLVWLKQRFEEGLTIRMEYEGKRPVGFTL